MKHIIIGGVAGGATAAARIRRADEEAEIVLLEKGKYISYANCGLPYYIGGAIAEREKLFLQTPASFGGRFNIDVRIENEAVGIDTAAKSVEVRRADGSTYTESYDKLLLSPGASPVRPPLKGIDSEGIFTLRNVDDTDRIKNYITTRTVASAVVVGAGFIGLEMAENLHRAGAGVSIVEMGNQVMAPVDFSIASHVHQHLLQKGVHLYLEQSVERFEKRDDKIEVFFTSGKSIATDLVILSIGIRPETALAKAAGLRIGETGGIWVDDYLQTSAADVYAVGDAIEFPHPLTGKPRGDRNFYRQGVRYDGGFDRTCGQAAQTVRHSVCQFDHPFGLACGVLSRCVAADPQADLRPRERQTLRRSVRGLRRSGQAYRPDCPADQAGRHGLRSDKSRARLRPSFFIGKRPDRHSRLCGRQHHQRGDACGDLAANGGSGSLRHAVSGCAYPRGTRLRSDPRFGEHSAGRASRPDRRTAARQRDLHLLRRWSTGIPGLENSDGTRVYPCQKLVGRIQNLCDGDRADRK